MEAGAPLKNWVEKDARLTRVYRFGSFRAAIAFMVEASFLCEARDHHPEWTNVYDRLTVALATHDVGAVTWKDRALAAELDALHAARFGQSLSDEA